MSGAAADGVVTFVIDLTTPKGHPMLQRMLPYVADKDPIYNVYFRIDTAYRSRGEIGGWSREEQQGFYEVMDRLFASEGFSMGKRKTQSESASGTRGLEDVHCHPDDVSGYFKLSCIERIAQLLAKEPTVHKVRGVDIYRVFLNFMPEELQRACSENMEAFTPLILDYFTTFKRTQYRPISADLIRACIPLKGSCFVGAVAPEQGELFKIAGAFMREAVAALVKKGYVKEAVGQGGVPIFQTRKTKEVAAVMAVLASCELSE